jgi:hypothetical protein
MQSVLARRCGPGIWLDGWEWPKTILSGYHGKTGSAATARFLNLAKFTVSMHRQK